MGVSLPRRNMVEKEERRHVRCARWAVHSIPRVFGLERSLQDKAALRNLRHYRSEGVFIGTVVKTGSRTVLAPSANFCDLRRQIRYSPAEAYPSAITSGPAADLLPFCRQAMLLFCNDTETWANGTCIADLGISILNAGFSVSAFVCTIFLCTDRSATRTLDIGFRFQHHSSRWVLTFCLAAIHGFEVADGVLILLRTSNALLNLHSLLLGVSSLAALLVATVLYDTAEKRRKPRQLLILLMFWPLKLTLRTAKLGIFIQQGVTFQYVVMEANTAAVIAYVCMLAVEVAVFNGEKYIFWKAAAKKSRRRPLDFEHIMYRFPYASLPAKCTFSWLLPLFRRGYHHILELEDLGYLPDEHLNEYQYNRFNTVFEAEKARAKQKGRTPSLWHCYFKTYWKTAAFGSMIKMVGDITGLIGPLSIRLILNYVETVTDPNKVLAIEGPYPTYVELLSNAYVITVVILIATFMQSTFSNNFNHMAIMEGVHVRSALQSMVYRKSLCLSSDLDVGAVVNHMSVDAFNVMLLFSMGHYIWAVPFKLLLLLVLLYEQLGYSALIGAAIVYSLSPVQYWVCKWLSKLQKEALTVSDKRIKHTSELLQGIKLLKLHGWEKVYSEMVKDIRKEELKVLKKDAIFVAVNTFITQGSAILLTLVTFSIYSLVEGKQLTPAKVFSGLALFNQLTVPLYIIPFVIPIVINAMVSTRRLAEFFNMPEIDADVPWKNMEVSKATIQIDPDDGSVVLDVKDVEMLEKCLQGNPEDADPEDADVFVIDAYSPVEGQPIIAMNHAYFTWDKKMQTPTLQDITLQVPTGKLTIIIGPVGSGKTTLLSGMLGELTPFQGTVEWARVRFVAYVPQKAWLLNDTVKENILFGQMYDGKRYHQVIQACALQPDIDLLPARDMTEIGERGVNLSGGQKQRIALARALYSHAKLVILDDPLSALDAHVAKQVFDTGIKKHLLKRHRTVVLVTHKLDLLVHASRVVVLENGKIRCQGSMTEIEKDPETSKMLRTAVFSGTVTPADNTARERQHLVRMLTKQSLYVSGSTQDARSSTSQAVGTGRQLSYDPSCPLPLNDCANEDTVLSQLTQSAMPPMGPGDTSPEIVSHIGTTPPMLMRPWKLAPPLQVSVRVSQPSDPCAIQEEEEQEEPMQPPEGLLASVSSQYSVLGSTNLVVPIGQDGKLIVEEERQEGKIPLKVYLGYMRACRTPFVIVVILLFAADQGAKLGTDFWLTGWSETSKTYNSSVVIKEDDTTWNYLMGYAGLSIFCVILSLATNLSAQLVSLRSIRVFHNNMIDTIVQCPMRFFDTNPVGRILNRFSGDMGIIDRKLPITLPVLMRFLMLCIAAILTDIFVTPIFIVVIIPVLVVYYFVQFFFRCSSRELQRLDTMTKGPIFSHFSETLAGLSTIRAFKDQRRFIEKMDDRIDTNNLTFIMVNCANCWLGICLDYLGGIILFLATISCVTAATTGSISPSFVGIAMTYTLLIPIYLNWLVRQFSNVEMYMSSVERVEQYIDLPIETVERPIHVEDNWPSKGAVVFDKVSIRYEEGQPPVLKQLTLSIKGGQKVGICGRTGSGKSSLVMGLFKMVPVSEGTITIDKVNIAEVSFEDLRSRLSIIPQEPVLFSGTVRQNLDPKKIHTEDELWAVLEKSQLKEAVLAAGGLDGAVAEEGSNFSIGQKQLFCLARSLLQRSKVLVLDEATSSLDVDLDKLLQNTILTEWKRSTVLAIAHRVTSLLSFDRVVVLDAGSIVEDGKPSELKKRRNGIFKSLLKEYESNTA